MLRSLNTALTTVWRFAQRSHLSGFVRLGRVPQMRNVRVGDLLPGGYRQPRISGVGQLHRRAVSPAVAHQAQVRAAQGRELSTLAPLPAAWSARTGVGTAYRGRTREVCS